MSQKTLKTMKQYNSQDIYGIFSDNTSVKIYRAKS